MVKQKHLKRLVRSRMEKTGESYVSARSRVAARGAQTAEAPAPPPGEPRAGKLVESAALATLLAEIGLRAPHTGAPLTEALALGIAGGIGGAYWVFEYKSVPYPLFSLFTRHAWDSSKRLLEEACARLAIPHTFKETTSAAAAERALVDAVSSGSPAIVWVSHAMAIDSYLPPEFEAAVPFVVVVRAAAGGSGGAPERFEVLDRSAVPWHVSRAELAASRAFVRSDRQRLLIVAPPSIATIDLTTLRDAVRAGIAACVQEMVAAPAHLPKMVVPNNGLAGLEKFARLLGDTRDKKGWALQFPPGLPLYKGLTGIFRAIEIEGAGGALRPLFADFLDEAATILERPALRDVAATYREIGDAWSTLANRALPTDVPLLAETAALMHARRSAFSARGAAAAEEIRALDTRLKEVEREAAERFPLDAAAAKALLAELSDAALAIAAREREAVAALEAAVA